VTTVDGVQVTGGPVPGAAQVLTPGALELVARLTRRFRDELGVLLARRRERQARFDAGELPDFLPETAHVR